jgi:apolipoprotein D and lipocalin family protein
MNTALLDLQERVRAAELRVIARDAALRRRLEQARTGWQRQVRRVRWLPPTAATALAAGALWWLLKPRPVVAAAPSPPRPGSGGVPPRSGARWVRAAGLLWPLLPVRWRARVSPAAAAAWASIGLPLLEALLADGRPPPATAPEVDLRRYAGTWYEVAQLPARFEHRCAGQASVAYALHDHGLQVTHRCRSDDGREQLAVGEARVVADSGDARLQVSFLPALLRTLPFAWAEHWIVHVDDDYRFAVVGDPGRRHCQLLAREPQPAAADRDRLVRIAAARGFAVERLVHHVDAAAAQPSPRGALSGQNG